jgi:hypothetical protein
VNAKHSKDYNNKFVEEDDKGTNKTPKKRSVKIEIMKNIKVPLQEGSDE